MSAKTLTASEILMQAMQEAASAQVEAYLFEKHFRRYAQRFGHNEATAFTVGRAFVEAGFFDTCRAQTPEGKFQELYRAVAEALDPS